MVTRNCPALLMGPSAFIRPHLYAEDCTFWYHYISRLLRFSRVRAEESCLGPVKMRTLQSL